MDNFTNEFNSKLEDLDLNLKIKTIAEKTIDVDNIYNFVKKLDEDDMAAITSLNNVICELLQKHG